MASLKSFCCCGSASDNNSDSDQKPESKGIRNTAYKSEPTARTSTIAGDKKLDTENAHVVPKNSTDGKKVQIGQIDEIKLDDRDKIPVMEH